MVMLAKLGVLGFIAVVATALPWQRGSAPTVVAVVFAADDVIAGDSIGQLIRLDGRTGILRSTHVEYGPLESMAAFRDGSRVGLGYLTGRVGVFARKGWRGVHWFPAHERAIHALLFLNGSQFATGSRDRSARRFDGSAQVEEVQIPGVRQIQNGSMCCGSPVEALAASPSGQSVLIGCEDGYAYIWRRGLPLTSAFVPTDTSARGTAAIHISDDLKWTWVTSSGDAVFVNHGGETRIPKAAPIRVQIPELRIAAISPDGSLIAAGTYLGEIRVFDARSGTTLSSWHVAGAVTALSFDSTSAILATANTHRSVAAWRARTGEKLWQFEAAMPALSLNGSSAQFAFLPAFGRR
jgi:WD40 repeat protein